MPIGLADGANGTAHLSAASQPPASTVLADRIVAANGETSEQLQRERFTQLLEISTSLDENGEPTIGTDIESNHTLILIIFKAGLDRFARGKNPSAQGDEDVLDQTLQSLKVIRIALTRTPEVLFHSSSDNGELSDNLSEVPLFVWLIPRLLSLRHSIDVGCEELAHDIWDTLTLIVQLEAKCSGSHHYCASISQFVHDLFNGTFIAILSRHCKADENQRSSLHWKQRGHLQI